MSEMQKSTELQSDERNDEEGVTRYCLMCADAPLCKLMEDIMDDAPDGQRNPEYSRIIPFPGLMHKAMAYQDVVRRILYDAGMDSLAADAGLSPNLIGVLRIKKEYKTSLRLFRDCRVVWMLRIVDAVFDDGDLRSDMDELQQFSIQRDSLNFESSGSVASVIQMMADAAREDGPVSANMQESLHVDDLLFGTAMEKLGGKVVSVVQKKANREDDPNFAFFAKHTLFETLNPSVFFYYASRAGHLRAMQAVIRHILLLLFTTSKTTYMLAGIRETKFELTEHLLEFLSQHMQRVEVAQIERAKATLETKKTMKQMK